MANYDFTYTGAEIQAILDTGKKLKDSGYIFLGVATPSTNPGTPTQKVYYEAKQAGTYTNFGGAVLPDGLSLLIWNGSWTSKTVMCGDGGVFDISVYKSSGGTLATFADLAAALDGGNNIPASARKGGMSVKFVQSSDNKYIQYRLMSDSFNTTPSNWQSMNVDEEPTAGSNNLVKSGGVYEKIIIETPVNIEPVRVISNSYLVFSPNTQRGNVQGDFVGSDVYIYRLVKNSTLKITGSTGSSLAWGVYSSDEISHDSILSFGNRASVADGVHIIEVSSECYLAVTQLKTGIYEIYTSYNIDLKQKVEEVSNSVNDINNDIEDIKNSLGGFNPYYRYSLSNDVISIAYGYGEKDIVVRLQKKGGNNLFDFLQLSTIDKGGEIEIATETSIVFIGTDWHAPFIIAAKNNINGDNIDSRTGQYNKYFTGGNHQYNNTGSGSTATARCTDLEFYINGNKITEGNGYANRIEIRWTNLVQGYNTTKADGSGREILKENHKLIFGDEIEEFIELMPLEDVVMDTWYGIQYSGRATADPNVQGPYAYTRFIGAENKQSLTGIVQSGKKLTTSIIGSGTTDAIKVSVDPTYDLGDRYCMLVDESGAFTSGGNKTYFCIVREKDMNEGDYYYLHVGWKFYPISN